MRGGIVLTISRPFFEVFHLLTEGKPPPVPAGYSPFDFGYCMTVHKAQGSEWENVLIIDENHGEDRLSWLYTAITRASKAVRICRR